MGVASMGKELKSAHHRHENVIEDAIINSKMGDRQGCDLVAASDSGKRIPENYAIARHIRRRFAVYF
jgi:hypothetical protein